jgi:hypothetical protein
MQTFSGITSLWFFVCFEVLIVLIAMSIDLASGIHKARIRGEKCSSYGLKRSVSKFILYVGSVCIACGIDSIFFACQFWEIVHFTPLAKVPVASTIMSIFICIVEMRSVWEKAEVKQKREALDTAQAIWKLIDPDALKKIIEELKTTKGNETVD